MGERGKWKTDRQINRQTVIQNGKERDRRTDRQYEKETDRQTETETDLDTKQSNGAPVNGPVPPGGSSLSPVITCQGFMTALARSSVLSLLEQPGR